MDALEFSVSLFPESFGGYLQVSGLTFDLDLNKNAQVQRDRDNMFEGFGSDERRVSNIMVNGEPIDPDRIYTVGSLGYTLFSGGDGYKMFSGEKVELEKELVDVDVIADYMRSFGGKVPEKYAEIQDRINYPDE